MNTTASTRTSDKGWLLSKFNSIFSRPTLYDSSTVGLSADIIFIIVHYLPENRDIINLAYTSKEIYASLLPIIYRSVQFETAARCNERLSFLIRNPHLARTIRKMTLRPAFLIQPTPEGLAAEQSLCRTLEILVPNLVSLETFVWEGLKMPNESIWLGLRYSCPDLKHIASSFGVQEIPEHSQLFQFRDLVSFSLFSPDYQTSDYEAFVRRIQNGDPVPLKKFPLAMWDMLLKRCPGLEELTLGSPPSGCHSDYKFDLSPMTKGRWPKLQSLVLGRTSLGTAGADSYSFQKFIASHRNLKKFHVIRSGLSRMGVGSPPASLESFAGHAPDVVDVATRHHSLKELIMTSTDTSLNLVQCLLPCLQRMPLLETLALWISSPFTMESEPNDPDYQDYAKVLQKVFQCHPKLSNFTLMCSGKDFKMADLHLALADGPKLTSLELWMVQRRDEKTMLQTAAYLASQTPTLKHIKIQYSKGSYNSCDALIHQRGTYEVVRGDTATRLYAREIRGVKGPKLMQLNHFVHTLRS